MSELRIRFTAPSPKPREGSDGKALRGHPTNRPEDSVLEFLYMDEGYTLREMAECFGVSVSTIKRWTRAAGLRKNARSQVA